MKRFTYRAFILFLLFVSINIITFINAMVVPVNIIAANNDIRVYDNADLLTNAEEEKLNDYCLSYGDDYKLDIVILTTNDTSGKKSKTFADDFYDEMDFGYDQPFGDGLLFLINMDEREAYISTSGYARNIITDSRVDSILDDAYEYLSDADYYNSCMTFLKEVKKYAANAYDSSDNKLYDSNNRNPVQSDNSDIYNPNYPSNYESSEIKITDWWVQLLISVIIGGVVVGIMAFNAGGAVTVNANTYMDSSKTRPNVVRDHYLRTTTTSVKKEKPKSNNSGGGSHTGSGGRTHGGGGRKF